MMEAQQIWQAALDHIRSQIDTARFNTWFGGTSALSFRDGVLTIKTSSPFVQTQLETQFYEMVSEAVGKEISVQFVYEERSGGNSEHDVSHSSTGKSICPHCGNRIAQ